MIGTTYPSHHAIGAGARIPSSTYICIENYITHYKSVLQVEILKKTSQLHQANQTNVPKRSPRFIFSIILSHISIHTLDMQAYCKKNLLTNFELLNLMASYATATGSKTWACGMRKVRILEVRGRRFVNARAQIFCCSHSTRHGSIQQKHPAPFAGSVVAHTAPCTSVFCSRTLQLLQDPSLHSQSRRLRREISGSRQLSSLKFGNEREYIHCCTYDALHRGTLQRHPAPSTEYTVAYFLNFS